MKKKLKYEQDECVMSDSVVNNSQTNPMRYILDFFTGTSSLSSESGSFVVEDYFCVSENTVVGAKKDLGPLHMRLCEGINFTSAHQLPVVKPVHIGPPDDIKAFYRINNRCKCEERRRIFAHFYTDDVKFEKVWNRPFAYVDLFRRMDGLISTDYSILTNMVESQRQWNDFRNKLLAAFYQSHGATVVASPSWSSDLQNIDRYMEGWPHNSVIAVNSTGVRRDRRARKIWLDGYWAMNSILSPSHILRYGGRIEGENTQISTYYVNDNRR